MKTRKTATKSITVLMATVALMAGLTSLTAPTLATARPFGGHMPPRVEMRMDNRISDRIANLQDRIRTGERTRQLSHREAVRLTGKLDDITSLKRGFERSGHGLNGQETATLNARLDMLSGQIRVQGHDGNRR